MSLLSLSTHTADFERKTTTVGTSGGQVETFAAAYEDVRGSLQPASGDTVEKFMRMSMRISHVFYTETAITLVAGDRMVIGSAKYIVQWFADQGGRGRVYAAYVLKTD